MTSENTTENKVGSHPVDILSENLAQASAITYLLIEQFEPESNRCNKEILSNSVWAIQSHIERAINALNDQILENKHV